MRPTEADLARARYIRTVLTWHGHTQTDLGELLQITQAAASQKLRGRRAFRTDELVKIAEAYGIEPGTLLIPPEVFPALPSWPNCEVRWSEALFGRSFESFAVAGVAA